MLLTNDLGIWIQIKQHTKLRHMLFKKKNLRHMDFLILVANVDQCIVFKNNVPINYLPILENSSKVVDSRNIWKKKKKEK